MKIEATDKKLSRSAIAEEIEKDCEEAVLVWRVFERFIMSISVEVLKRGWDDEILINDTSDPILNMWYKGHPEFEKKTKQWLIDHWFAKEINKPFKPVSFIIRSEEDLSVLWHKLNMHWGVFLRNYDVEKYRPSAPTIPTEREGIGINTTLWGLINNCWRDLKRKDK